jgi:hypothetical protein
MNQRRECLRVLRGRGQCFRRGAAVLTVGILFLSGAPAFAARFETDLDPVSYDNSTRTIVEGEGKVTATLTGTTLILHGRFDGLSSPATVAHLGIAEVKGAPTDSFFADITVTKSPAGTITGTATLTPAQLAAINASALFIRLDTVKGTAGSLWGWFEPAGSAR